VLIDIHAHLFTPGMMSRHAFWGPFMKKQGLTVGHFSLGTSKRSTASSDEEAEANMLSRMTHASRRRLMAERGVDKLVLSTPSHAFMYWAATSATSTRTSATTRCRPTAPQTPSTSPSGRMPTSRSRPAVKEIDRAVRQLGAKGLCVGGANFNGLQAHSEELFPVWEKLSQLDVPIMVHGFNQSIYLGEKHTDDKFETTSIVGDCFDETLFFWYLICGGALDAFPTLKTYICHAGGMAVFQLGRLDELNRSMAPDARNKRRLSEYMPTSGSTSMCTCRLCEEPCARSSALTAAWSNQLRRRLRQRRPHGGPGPCR